MRAEHSTRQWFTLQGQLDETCSGKNSKKNESNSQE